MSRYHFCLGNQEENNAVAEPKQTMTIVPSAMDGDNVQMRSYFRHMRKIVQSKSSLLNFGAGTTFCFESACHAWNPNLKIVCADLTKPASVPSYVDSFHCLDLTCDFNVSKSDFDIVTLFEVIEHVDDTDGLLLNAMKHCKPGGIVALSFPNLASLFTRIEILLGFQPHTLEVSNRKANFGTGPFGPLNNPNDLPIHHIRGFTRRAGHDFLRYHDLEIQQSIGGSVGRLDPIWRFVPGFAPVSLFICMKKTASQ